MTKSQSLQPGQDRFHLQSLQWNLVVFFGDNHFPTPFFATKSKVDEWFLRWINGGRKVFQVLLNQTN